MHFLRSIAIFTLLIASGMAQESSSSKPAHAAGSARTREALTAKANAGDAAAAFVLGNMYEQGNGVPQNAVEAVKWYRKAAELGNATAQFNLGLILAKGRGVTPDPSEGAKWYQKAAEQGDEQAAINLGILYAQGSGVKQDAAQAAHWFRVAAEAGNAMAEYNLGLLYSEQLYSEGKSAAEDEKQAALWMGKAAEHGVVAAQNNLGVLYADGRGVEKNLVQAYKWFALAGEAGDPNAADAIKALTAEMKPEEVAQGKRLAEEWMAAHAE